MQDCDRWPFFVEDLKRFPTRKAATRLFGSVFFNTNSDPKTPMGNEVKHTESNLNRNGRRVKSPEHGSCFFIQIQFLQKSWVATCGVPITPRFNIQLFFLFPKDGPMDPNGPKVVPLRYFFHMKNFRICKEHSCGFKTSFQRSEKNIPSGKLTLLAGKSPCLSIFPLKYQKKWWIKFPLPVSVLESVQQQKPFSKHPKKNSASEGSLPKTISEVSDKCRSRSINLGRFVGNWTSMTGPADKKEATSVLVSNEACC